MDSRTILKTLRRTRRALYGLISTHGGYDVEVKVGSYKTSHMTVGPASSSLASPDYDGLELDPVNPVSVQPRKIFGIRRLRVYLPHLYNPKIHPSTTCGNLASIKLDSKVEMTLKAVAPAVVPLLLDLPRFLLEYNQGNVTSAYQLVNSAIEILEDAMTKRN